MEQVLTHRFRGTNDYLGIPIHAAPGVHEFGTTLAESYLPAGASVIDIGCGSGALSARLADAGFDVLATDVELTGFAANVSSRTWDAGAPELPAAAGSMDGVIALEVLEHVENPMAVLRNFKRLLRPGGKLICSTPHTGHIRSRLRFLMRGAPSYFGPEAYHGSGHRTLLPDWLLRELLTAAGFTIDRVAYAGEIETHPVLRAALPVLHWAGRALLNIPRADADDGTCVFFVAH
jgi:2-polyprenyl-3-methyl-5-hydroxy-6-metoxy-1,4-benzoquinol methylase